jgi:hypothetical protein
MAYANVRKDQNSACPRILKQTWTQATDFMKRIVGPVLRISLYIATLLAWDKYYAYSAGQITLTVSSKFSWGGGGQRRGQFRIPIFLLPVNG